MKVRMARDGKGDLQFIIEAQDDMERIALRAFRDQHYTPGHTFFVHGWTFQVGTDMGPSSFNFGTVKSGKPVRPRKAKSQPR